MCTANNEIKFCTCAEGNIDEIKNIYIWTLNRYMSSKESRIRGIIMRPIEGFENGISTDGILSKLNMGNIFDFEYTPQERDTLQIRFNAKHRVEYQYFSLIFKDKIWQKGRNPAFTSKEEKIAEGEVQIMYKKENLFLKHCEDLQAKYGIEIPESVKIKASGLPIDSSDPVYLAIKNFKECKIFYTEDFIELATRKYFDTHPNAESSEKLQLMIDQAQNSFSLPEKKFVSHETDFSFLNDCFHDLGGNIDKGVVIAIPIQDREYLIVNGFLYGRTVVRSQKDKRYFKNKNQKLKYEGFESSKKS